MLKYISHNILWLFSLNSGLVTYSAVLFIYHLHSSVYMKFWGIKVDYLQPKLKTTKTILFLITFLKRSRRRLGWLLCNVQVILEISDYLGSYLSSTENTNMEPYCLWIPRQQQRRRQRLESDEWALSRWEIVIISWDSLMARRWLYQSDSPSVVM